MLGQKPKLKIIQTTHTAELAYNFGRKVRNLMGSGEYKMFLKCCYYHKIVKLQEDGNTNYGGEYFAAGVGGAITGRGADFLLLMILIQSRTP